MEGKDRNILEFVVLSETAKSVKGEFLTANTIKETYNELSADEKEALLMHYMINGTAFLFKNCPLLYEQLIRFISDRMKVCVNDIKLIGSTKLGFTMDPQDYGRKITEKSDLDFTIISNELFIRFQNENMKWSDAYSNGELQPKQGEVKFWQENQRVNKRNIAKGFIDCKKVPTIENLCPYSIKMQKALELIIEQLSLKYSIQLSNANVRIYKDFESFLKQLKLNTNSLLKLQQVE